MGLKIKLIIIAIILLIISSGIGYIYYLKYKNAELTQENSLLQVSNQSIELALKDEQNRFKLLQDNSKKQQEINKILINNDDDATQDDIIEKINALFD